MDDLDFAKVLITKDGTEIINVTDKDVLFCDIDNIKTDVGSIFKLRTSGIVLECVIESVGYPVPGNINVVVMKDSYLPTEKSTLIVKNLCSRGYYIIGTEDMEKAYPGLVFSYVKPEMGIGRMIKEIKYC